ncbi:MAG: motility protein A [Phycisphaerales bacterium]|nr:motility protein A [Phycisphaerales bacterium]
MDIGTIIGFIVAIVGVLMSVIMGGGGIGGFVDIPSILVVFGGTIGAIIVCFPIARILELPKIMMKALFWTSQDPVELVKELVRYAEVARREGILALENLVPEMKDPFIVRGVKMAVDGTDPELIREVMEKEMEAADERHGKAKYMIDTIGRMAPAYGMIGTLMGLIMMLSNMSDPSKIGPGMAVALITTLYGALIANMCTGPIADKLASRAAEESLIRSIVVAGVMSIQSGDNPRIVESKLLTFLPPSKRGAIEQKEAA